ncbi:MAG: DegT/DnrJ/EryC1/StrS family aminotransferase, partial [Flavobacterium sp.]|nr:DegT/DnrJ/EryC1/StrS family aminotransferase [Flavobacterium sp.]
MINVTQTYLPPIEEYQAILQRAWDAKWLTNRGQLVKELEEKLKKYLQVSNVTLTTNGTLPIQIAIKAMDLKGEIITTPFSYVATTASIVWENCTPVFVDIHPEYLTIDETKIEAAITSKTSAILATHVFGNPCHVEVIEQIAKKYNLKVIYDAAHCFGVTYNGKSIFEYGDVSTCSFHATKIFHTGEGGCWITNNDDLHQKIYYHHNFGHKNQEEFLGLGTNAKMSELQAAMGLAVFNHLEEIFEGRKKAVQLYNELLQNSSLQRLK